MKRSIVFATLAWTATVAAQPAPAPQPLPQPQPAPVPQPQPDPVRPAPPPVPIAQPTTPPAPPPPQKVVQGTTEDHDVAPTEILPWYLPDDTIQTPKRKASPLTGKLGHHSISGDLNGSIDEVQVSIGPGNPWMDIGVAIGSANLTLGDKNGAGGTARTATNNATVFEASLGVAHNYGIELYHEGELHVFLLGPAIDFRLGGQTGQATNQTMPITAGPTPSVFYAAAMFEPIGVRLASCQSWFVDVRLSWGTEIAARTFDPSNTTAVGNENEIDAMGTSIGVEIEGGYTFWK